MNKNQTATEITKQSVSNIVELRRELVILFESIKTDEVSLPKAKELVNTAGKIINSVKVQLEYAYLRKETPVIEFLGGEAGTLGTTTKLIEPATQG